MTEDAKSPHLPGGSLLSAYLDRQLMAWSDRGGASRYIGDGWAAHCSRWLSGAVGAEWPVPHGQPFVVSDILRLDDIPGVSSEANHYHLENPDFLIVGSRPDEPATALVEAVDAKFAADRIKPSQVSAQIVENLLTVPREGVTRQLLQETLDAHGFKQCAISDGSFMCPDSALTEFLLKRASRQRDNPSLSAEIIRIQPSPAAMFNGAPAAQLIGQLARQDQLPVSPRENLLSTIYYFRVACACVYLYTEQHAPLFTVNDAEPAPVGLVSAELTLRAMPEYSAYRLMLDLVDEAEVVREARQSLANVASLPLRMTEIRGLLQNAGLDEESGKTALRNVRRDLELEFRRRLFKDVGEISADDPRALNGILDEVARAARELRADMHSYATQLVAGLSVPQSPQRAG